MRTLTIPAMLFTLVLAACRVDPVTAPSAPASLDVAAARHQATVRELKGRCETTFPRASFPLPPVLRQADDGVCQLTHLGRSAIYSIKDINFAAGTQTILEVTFTAANGDVLRGTGSGTNVPVGGGLVNFAADVTFDGGTGRFASVTGQARMTGTANLATNSSVLEIAGSIAY